MEVRKEKVSDFYNTVVDWWERHSLPYEGKRVKYPQIPQVILPQNVFVLSEDGIDLYCVFFYKTDSAMAWIANPTKNPSYPKREGALSFLFDAVEVYARENNYFLLFTTSPVKNVQEALIECDYEIGDEQVNQYYKKLVPKTIKRLQ